MKHDPNTHGPDNLSITRALALPHWALELEARETASISDPDWSVCAEVAQSQKTVWVKDCRIRYRRMNGLTWAECERLYAEERYTLGFLFDRAVFPLADGDNPVWLQREWARGKIVHDPGDDAGVEGACPRGVCVSVDCACCDEMPDLCELVDDAQKQEWLAGLNDPESQRTRVLASTEPLFGLDSLSVPRALALPPWALELEARETASSEPEWSVCAEVAQSQMTVWVKDCRIRLRRTGPDGLTWDEALELFKGDYALTEGRMPVHKDVDAETFERWWRNGEVRARPAPAALPDEPAAPAADADDMDVCPDCDGTRHADPCAGCQTCHSTGRVLPERDTDDGGLLPCPFCGSHARRLEMGGELYDEVWCTNDPDCAARVEGDDYDDAVRIWNTRAPAAAKEEE